MKPLPFQQSLRQIIQKSNTISSEKVREIPGSVLPPAPPISQTEFLYPSKLAGSRSDDQITKFTSKARLSNLMQSHTLLLESNRQTELVSTPKLIKAITQTEMTWMAEMLAQNLKLANGKQLKA